MAGVALLAYATWKIVTMCLDKHDRAEAQPLRNHPPEVTSIHEGGEEVELVTPPSSTRSGHGGASSGRRQGTTHTVELHPHEGGSEYGQARSQKVESPFEDPHTYGSPRYEKRQFSLMVGDQKQGYEGEVQPQFAERSRFFEDFS